MVSAQRIDAVAELQRAAELLTKNWVLIIPTAVVALIGGIISAVFAASTAAALQQNPDALRGPAAASLLAGSGIVIVLSLIVAIVSIVAQTVVLAAAQDVWNGRPANLSVSLGYALSRLGDVLIALVLLFLIFIIPGALCFVLIGIPIVLVVAFLMMFVMAAVVIGKSSGTNAIGESYRLTSKNVTPSLIAFAAIVVVGIVGAICHFIFGHIPVVNVVAATVIGGVTSAYSALVSARFYDLLRGASAFAPQQPYYPPPPTMPPPPSTTY